MPSIYQPPELPPFGRPLPGRSCTGCVFCCVHVPVDEIALRKPVGVACPHIRQASEHKSTGCGIYLNRPDSCRAWSCRWLFDPATLDQERPNIAGYALDPITDTVMVNGKPAPVLQIWTDPAQPGATKNHALRNYLRVLFRLTGIPALIRTNSTIATLLVPPDRIGGKWLERSVEMTTRESINQQIRDAAR